MYENATSKKDEQGMECRETCNEPSQSNVQDNWLRITALGNWYPKTEVENRLKRMRPCQSIITL